MDVTARGHGEEVTYADLVVQVLGTPTLAIAGRTTPFPPGRPGRVLTLLLLARGRVVPADRLVDEVWGQDLPEDARATLHTTVARTRRALGSAGERLQRQAAGYRFDLSGASVDADVFLRRLQEARAGAAVEGYDAALSAWHGDPWVPWAEDLARGEALQLHEAYVAAREERARLLLSAGRLTDAVGELQLLVAEQPLRDRPVALLMEALHRTGAAAEALAVFSRHRQALADELGLDPAPELAELQRRVLQRESTAPAMSSPPEPSGSPPAATSAGAPRAVPAGSPSPTVLHGRDRDLADLRGLLAMHRVVTLVGPGGVGKTTLASRARDGERSAWWVDLATVSGEAGVRAVTAAALAVETFPGGTPEAALRRRFATATGLLVLDNCEHVVGPVADLVVEVLECGAGLRLLATSRERLGLPEEHVFWLPPLELPPPDLVDLDVPSVALFLERARAASPDLVVDEATAATVSTLVRSLDGLPLAIELAASRVGVVSLTTLQRRLEDQLDLLQRHRSRRGPARHQTLTATIEWSYDLLSAEQQRAFRWLSTFAGPFGLDDAEALLGEGSTEAVIALVERSLLVRPGTQREEYRMLETLRSFARSRLGAEEAVRASEAHAAWATSFTSTAADGLDSAEEALWHELVELHLPDLASAVRRSIDSGDLSTAVRLVTDLYDWAYFRVRLDVLAWGCEVADHPSGRGETPGVLAAASSHAWMRGRHDLAAAYARRGIAAGGGSERPESVRVVQSAADTSMAVGDLDRAHELFLRAHATAKENGERGQQLVAASGLVLARAFQGRRSAAELDLLREAMAVDSPSQRAFGLYAEAEALTEAEPERALQLFTEARQLGESVHARLIVGVSLAAETALLGRVGALDTDTVQQTVLAVEHWLGSGNETLFVTCLRNVVPLLDRFGEHHAGVALAAATEAHTPDRPPYGGEKERLDLALERARAALTPAEYESAWREGRSRSLEEAARTVVRDLRALV